MANRTLAVSPIPQFSLELVNLVLVVAKLLERASKLTLVLRADLGARDGRHQAGRAADKELNVLLLGLGENSLEKVLGDEARTALPALGSLVEDVKGTEALGVCVLELVKLLLEENILLGDVAKDNGNLGLVVGVVEDAAAQLVHGGDTSAASNEADVAVLVLGPGVLGERALDGKRLSRSKLVDVGAHGAALVLLDEEVDVAAFIYKKQPTVSIDTTQWPLCNKNINVPSSEMGV